MLYFLIFVPNGYQSTTVFKLEENTYPGTQQSQEISIQSSMSGGEIGFESNLLVDHIGSLYMSNKLARQLSLPAYLSHHVDILSDIVFNFNNPFIFKFYLNNLIMHVDYDTSSEAFTVTASAQSPIEAQKILTTLIENINNDLAESTHQLAYFRLNETKHFLDSAKKNLIATNQALLRFQEKYKVTDPSERIQTLLGLQHSLQSDEAKAESHLRQLSYFMQANSPAIISAKQQVAALKQQIKRSSLFPSGGKSALEELSQKYTALKLNGQVAKENFIEANREYIAAKASFDQSKHVIVVIEPPDRESMPTSPKVFLTGVVSFLTLSVIFFTVRVFVNIIREHKD